ncbi:hypothetical protein SLA2020_380860 [Shorea laevis]
MRAKEGKSQWTDPIVVHRPVGTTRSPNDPSASRGPDRHRPCSIVERISSRSILRLGAYGSEKGQSLHSLNTLLQNRILVIDLRVGRKKGGGKALVRLVLRSLDLA